MPSYIEPPAYAHGPFREVFPDVFVVRGSARMGPLLAITRNMTVLRNGRDLTLISAVRLSPEGEDALVQLGEVRHLVKIGNFHGSDDPYYKRRFAPRVWAQDGAVHRGMLATDEVLAPGHAPVPAARVFVFERSMKPECAILLERDGGILLTCDSVQNWPDDFEGCTFFGKVMMKSFGFRGRAKIGPGWRRLAEPKQGENFGGDFKRLLGEPFRHVLSAHGEPLLGTAKEDLRRMVEKEYGAAVAHA
jgi:hypothetical protein